MHSLRLFLLFQFSCKGFNLQTIEFHKNEGPNVKYLNTWCMNMEEALIDCCIIHFIKQAFLFNATAKVFFFST